MKGILRLIAWNLTFVAACAWFYQFNPFTLKHATAVVTSNLGIEAFSGGETSSSDCYLPHLRYDYVVDGRPYSSSRLFLSGCMSEADATTVAEKLRVGKKINIYYDVLWPRRATIVKRGDPTYAVLFVTALTMYLLGWLAYIRSRRERAAQAGGTVTVPTSPAPNLQRIPSETLLISSVRLFLGLLLVAAGLCVVWACVAPPAISAPGPIVLIPMLMLLGGGYLMVDSLIQLRAWIMVGESWLRLDPVAPRVGHKLRGSIQFDRPPSPHWKLSLTLICQQRAVAKNGDQHLTPIWRHETPLPAASIVPFVFDLPPDAQESAPEDSSGALWHFELRGSGPVRFKRRFEFRLFAERP